MDLAGERWTDRARLGAGRNLARRSTPGNRRPAGRSRSRVRAPSCRCDEGLSYASMNYQYPDTNVLYRKLTKPFPKIVRGEGVFLFDEDGKRYLDGSGGAYVANLGHG